MKKLNKRLMFLFLFFLTNLIISIASSNYSIAQSNEFSYNTSSKFDIIEFADTLNSEQNVSKINLNLPSKDKWNLTDLEINFTDIEHNREIFIGENTILPDDTYYPLIKSIDLLGIQIKLTTTTKIYGAYVYGKVDNPSVTDDVYFQLKGFDNVNNRPNSTIYGGLNLDLNMSTELDWYYQQFESPIELQKGNYSLVINASTIQTGGTIYRWYYNDENPKYPELYRSIKSGTDWSIYNESTFLYILDQKRTGQFYPTDINMSIKINENYHLVENNSVPGTGKLKIDGNYPSLNNNSFSIEILNDLSSELLFNVSYNSKFIKNLHSIGTSIITDTGDYINWTLNPQIIDCVCNNSIRFDYPNSWEALKILKNGVDISDICIINIDQKYLEIPSSQMETANWQIKARARKIDFSITPGSITLEPLQDIQLSVNPPSIEGNVTFILYDPDGFLEYKEIKSVTSEDTTVSYQIPENPLRGIHTAYIIWNNVTDAGIQIQEFQINIPYTLDPMIIILIAIFSAIGLVGSITTYQVYKRVKAAKERYRQKIYNKYMDILNLQYILIIDKKSGLDVYQQKFTGKEMDATMVSGFLDAMRSFGIELTNTEEQTQTIKLEFQNSIILMSEFKNFRLILIMSEYPSDDFLESIGDLSRDIEKYYGNTIRQFKGGSIKEFRAIRDLIDKHLNTTLIYPLEINKSIDVKLSSEEKSIIKRSKHIMKKKNTNYIFVSYLLGQREEFSVKDAEIILNLIEKKVFKEYQNSQ